MSKVNGNDNEIVMDKQKAEGPLSYKCKECNVSYPKEWHMKLHMRTHKVSLNEDKIKSTTHPNVCPVCDKVCSARSELVRHIVIHDEARTLDRGGKCPIKKCLKSPSITVKLEDDYTHNIKESDDKQFCCDLCENSLSSKESLNIHKLIHKELSRYTCSEQDCTDAFSNHRNLELHVKNCHSISKNTNIHTCDDCGKQCKTNSALQIHSQKHSDVKHFICIECGKGLKNKVSLVYHMKLHTGERDHHCVHCDAKYVRSSALRNHILFIHRDVVGAVPFICSYCGKEFKVKDYLTKHITVHTGEKKYECNACSSPKKFRLKVSFEKHMDIHSGIKKYQCPQCDKKFRQRQARTVHVRRHNGDKRHKCNECKMAFIEPAGLRHHMRRHHS